MSETTLIKKALERCGYSFEKPTKGNLIDCFLDYVSCGYFGDTLDYDEAKDLIENDNITVKEMCINLLK